MLEAAGLLKYMWPFVTTGTKRDKNKSNNNKVLTITVTKWYLPEKVFYIIIFHLLYQLMIFPKLFSFSKIFCTQKFGGLRRTFFFLHLLFRSFLNFRSKNNNNSRFSSENSLSMLLYFLQPQLFKFLTSKTFKSNLFLSPAIS